MEQIRNTLEKELRTFTGKVNEAVQDFLNMADARATHDCAEFITSVNLKCNIIQQLATFFQHLKSSIEPPCGLKVTTVSETFCPRVQSVPMSYYATGSREIRVSDVLRFGPMLQNILMATSITNAVQTCGAMLSLRHIQMALATQSEVVLHSASSSSEFNIELCDSLSGDKRESIPSASTRTTVYPLQGPIHRPSLKDVFQDPLEAPIQKGAPPSMVQYTSPQYLDYGQGNYPEVQHQKQTTSQLIRFIRCSGDTEHLVQVMFFKGKPSATPQRQQEVTDKKAADKESKFPVGVEKRQFPSPALVFKLKDNGNAGRLIYSCVVATKHELWDVTDIFTEDADEVSEKPLGQETESPINSGGESYFGGIGVSRKGPSAAGKSRPATAAKTDAGGGLPSPVTVSRFDAAAARIPEFKIRKFEEMEVTVSHLVSPSDFFIQHVGSELQRLSQMMASSPKTRSSLAQMNCVPDIGACVAAWFPEHKLWFRAQVLRICGLRAGSETSQAVGEGEGLGADGGHIEHIELEVRRIDIGDTDCLPLYCLRELEAQTAAVPLQALQVALANVSPVNGQDWTPDAVDWFKDKVDGRTLFARLYPQGKDVRIELFMEKGKIGAMRRGSSLSLRLAQNGHAHHDDLNRWKGSVSEKIRRKPSQWEKRLISSYSQNRK